MVTGSNTTVMNITLPEAWSDLNDDQLRTVFRLFARDLTAAEIKTICLLRWNKMKVIGQTDRKGEYWVKAQKSLVRITARQMMNLTQPLNFIDEIPPFPVRYSKIGKHLPRQADFEGEPFEVYLYAENIFQGYLHTESMDLLKELVQVLYNSDRIRPDKATCIMAFYWFASLRNLMTNRFTHFYQPFDEVQPDNLLENVSLHKKLMDAVNAQIRALTGGDVTKEPYIMKMDTIRALTELDAKAYDAEQLKKQK